VTEFANSTEQLRAIEDELLRTLRAVVPNAVAREPIGVMPELPYAALRWLGPVEILDAETGGGQDVTHAWRLEITCAVELEQEEQVQGELQELVQRITAAFRNDPKAGGLVDNTHLELDSPADYFKRATLTGQDAGGPALYGCVLRLTCDFTEYPDV
jgi:hypothetical protein